MPTRFQDALELLRMLRRPSSGDVVQFGHRVSGSLHKVPDVIEGLVRLRLSELRMRLDGADEV